MKRAFSQIRVSTVLDAFFRAHPATIVYPKIAKHENAESRIRHFARSRKIGSEPFAVLRLQTATFPEKIKLDEKLNLKLSERVTDCDCE